MIKGVIFDFDGLLADTEYISYECFRDLLKEYGFSFSVSDYVQSFPGRKLIASLDYMNDHYHLDISHAEGEAYFRKRESYYMNKDGVPLKKGANELLAYLKNHGYKVALGTSSMQKRALPILRDNRIDQFFDAFVYGDEIKHGKPA